MSRPIITVEGLGKQYAIGTKPSSYQTLREALMEGLKAPVRRLRAMRGHAAEGNLIWALKDVSFEVQEGEVLGIIGRNGAGKSTLLKILSRITDPTEGWAEIRGRVASLLEVGTGFHLELTGRENIYLNGAILGMRKAEIERKFDEIVDFAEIEQFIDTPVKHYSSGMYVRLAFAVAAHLEPEILIVDEVLAVGDAAFQKKCLGKMHDVSSHGRTVLFVSHNMGMITSLCTHGLLLEHGQLVSASSASNTVLSYFSRGNQAPFSTDYRLGSQKVGDHFATLLEACLENEEGRRIGEIDIREPFRVRIWYQLLQAVPVPPYVNFHFFDARGEYAFVSAGNNFSGCSGGEPGLYAAQCDIPGRLLNNGTYFIGVALTFTHAGLHVSFFEKDALAVTIVDPIDQTLEESRCGYSGPVPGAVRPSLNWVIQKES